MTKDIDHESTDEIVCPYCGWEDTDSWDARKDDGEEECPDCEKKFSYSRHTTVSYTTTKLCIENGVEHQWREPRPPHLHNGKYIQGKHCEVCGKCELLPINEETGEPLP
jgi:hypothetical protein